MRTKNFFTIKLLQENSYWKRQNIKLSWKFTSRKFTSIKCFHDFLLVPWKYHAWSEGIDFIFLTNFPLLYWSGAKSKERFSEEIAPKKHIININFVLRVPYIFFLSLRIQVGIYCDMRSESKKMKRLGKVWLQPGNCFRCAFLQRRMNLLRVFGLYFRFWTFDFFELVLGLHS